MAYAEDWHRANDTSEDASDKDEHTKTERVRANGCELTMHELRRAFQMVRLTVVAKLERLAADSHLLASVLSRTTAYAQGISLDAYGVRSVSWYKMADWVGKFSSCTFTDGFVVVDAGAGRGLSGQSPLQPTPQQFITVDFVDIFGTAVPNCVVLSSLRVCTSIQLMHENGLYVIEHWDGLSDILAVSSFMRSAGDLHPPSVDVFQKGSTKYRGLSLSRTAMLECLYSGQPLDWLPAHISALTAELDFIITGHRNRKWDEVLSNCSPFDANGDLLMPDYTKCKELLDTCGAFPCLLRLRVGPKLEPTVVELRVLHRRRCVQIWVLEEFGRRLYRRQLACSRGAFTLLDGHASKRQDLLMHDLGRHPTGGAHLADMVTGDLKLATPRDKSDPSVVIRREADGACFIPARLLDGLLPAVLTQNFRFWNDHKILKGEPKPDSKMMYVLEIDLKASSVSNGCTVVHRQGGQEPMLLLDILEKPRVGSLLWRVATIFSRVDALAYVLAWGTPAHDLCRVELPRLGTSFVLKSGPRGEPRLFNADLQVRA